MLGLDHILLLRYMPAVYKFERNDHFGIIYEWLSQVREGSKGPQLALYPVNLPTLVFWIGPGTVARDGVNFVDGW